MPPQKQPPNQQSPKQQQPKKQPPKKQPHKKQPLKTPSSQKCMLCNNVVKSCICRFCDIHQMIHDAHLQCSLCLQDMLQTIRNAQHAQQLHKKYRNARSKERSNTRKAIFKLTQYTKFVDDARRQ